ncbi:MAG: hypothetical protein ACRDAX_02520 [Propionibacteriaceae bacterium]
MPYPEPSELAVKKIPTSELPVHTIFSTPSLLRRLRQISLIVLVISFAFNGYTAFRVHENNAHRAAISQQLQQLYAADVDLHKAYTAAAISAISHTDTTTIDSLISQATSHSVSAATLDSPTPIKDDVNQLLDAISKYHVLLSRGNDETSANKSLTEAASTLNNEISPIIERLTQSNQEFLATNNNYKNHWGWTVFLIATLIITSLFMASRSHRAFNIFIIVAIAMITVATMLLTRANSDATKEGQMLTFSELTSIRQLTEFQVSTQQARSAELTIFLPDATLSDNGTKATAAFDTLDVSFHDQISPSFTAWQENHNRILSTAKTSRTQALALATSSDSSSSAASFEDYSSAAQEYSNSLAASTTEKFDGFANRIAIVSIIFTLFMIIAGISIIYGFNQRLKEYLG